MAARLDDTEPTIVLVHGAWADATGFDREIRALQDRGFRMAAAQRPWTAAGFAVPSGPPAWKTFPS